MNKVSGVFSAAILLSSLTFSPILVAADSSQTDSLYHRIGGYNSVVAVVNDLFPRLAGDKQLGRFWAHRGDDGIAREKQLLIDFIAHKAGGDLYYRGREMELSHVGMRISAQDWKIMMQHLHATLEGFNLPQREYDEIVAFIESTRADIVELP